LHDATAIDRAGTAEEGLHGEGVSISDPSSLKKYH